MNKETGIKLFGESWFNILKNELISTYFTQIGTYLNSERLKKKKIYPDKENYFKAFRLTPFGEVKVIILGQDPYFTEGIADGLSFSSKKENYFPPSLKMIWNEIEKDIYEGFHLNANENLEDWSKQGVFLLNKYLSVEKDLPLSHSRIGWDGFTDFIIKELSDKRNNLVFLLWGAKAQQVEKLIDQTKHLILKAEHPAKASYDNRSWNCDNCFSKTNEYLKKFNKQVIKW